MSDTISSVTPLPENPQIYDISQGSQDTGMDTSAPSGISTIADLQKQAPQVYRAMLESLFWTFRGQQEESNKRIKENLRDKNAG